ncbi:hypothetical protein KC19_VG302400 [Ceratodon purpureus]|uniref:Uncharacterized protein n=1 Tax=Ceratodon purpureus TaxID=3225 RepID=A0A8T0HW52_CERPU|nr:hypothetical protein KC19_VG302400 [Ceratodon purpureus]
MGVYKRSRDNKPQRGSVKKPKIPNFPLDLGGQGHSLSCMWWCVHHRASISQPTRMEFALSLIKHSQLYVCSRPENGGFDVLLGRTSVCDQTHLWALWATPGFYRPLLRISSSH